MIVTPHIVAMVIYANENQVSMVTLLMVMYVRIHLPHYHVYLLTPGEIRLVVIKHQYACVHTAEPLLACHSWCMQY